MRKLLSFLLVLLAVFTLAACNNEDKSAGSNTEEPKTEEWVEPVDDTTFEEFLDEKVNDFDSAALDEAVGEVEANPEQILQIKVPNTSIAFKCTGAALSTDMDGVTGVLWQEGTVLYANAEVAGESSLVKLDLATLVAMIPTGEDAMKPSEMLDALLAEALGEGTTLDSLLESVNFTLADFTDKGEGVYELKHSAVARIVSNISKGAVKAEDLEAQLAEMFDKLVVSFKYNNGKVRNITVDMANEEQSQNMSVDLKYGPNGLNGFDLADTLSVKQYSYTDPEKLEMGVTMTLNVSASEEEVVADVDFAMEESHYGQSNVSVKANLTANKETLTANIEVVDKYEIKDEYSSNEKVVATVNGNANGLTASIEVTEDNVKLGTITADLKFANEWISEGTVVVESFGDEEDAGVMTITLAGGEAVKAPTVDTTTAVDLFELISSSGNSGYEDVYYPEEEYK